MNVLPFILSTLGTICTCVPPLLKGKNMKLILLLTFSTNVLLSISYILAKAYTGAASCCVGAILTIINYFFSRKSKPIPVWLIVIYAAAFLFVNILVFAHIVDIVAMLAALALTLGLCQKNGRKYRLWALTNTLLWIIYDAITLSFGPLSTHAIVLIMIVVGIIIHDTKKQVV